MRQIRIADGQTDGELLSVSVLGHLDGFPVKGLRIHRYGMVVVASGAAGIPSRPRDAFAAQRDGAEAQDPF